MSEWTVLRDRAGLSERDLARAAGVARMTLRSVERSAEACRLSSLRAVASRLGRQVDIVLSDPRQAPDCSTIAVAYRVLRDGDASWKVHFVELVDEYRRTLDGRLLLLPPPAELSGRLTALLAAIVVELCVEVGAPPPPWAGRPHYLDQPWFVAGSEALKATALQESPLPFRRNNIFVLRNFLSRT